MVSTREAGRGERENTGSAAFRGRAANETLVGHDPNESVAPSTPGRRVVLSPTSSSTSSETEAPVADHGELHEVVVLQGGGETKETVKESPESLEQKVSVKTQKESSQASTNVSICRICMDAIHQSELSGSGEATHLGCACVSGYMHRSCAKEYLTKRDGAVAADHQLTCEGTSRGFPKSRHTVCRLSRVIT